MAFTGFGGEMKNKILSLIIVTAIYIFAIAAAAVTAVLLNGYIESAILILFIADVVATIIVFVFSLIFKNASVYDPYWSVAPLCLMIGYYLLSGAEFSALHLIVILPLVFWAVRLTFNWARGFDNLKWVDWRYENFRKNNPKLFPLISFTGIMLMPTILVFAGMIPFYYIIMGVTDIAQFILGGSIILAAAIYQTIADEQKLKFRKNPENKGKCIDAGLWRYSRHPNYFGEIMIWWGVFVCSFNNFHLLSLIGAVLITLLFFFISTPMMEKHILLTRPEYKDYQRIVMNSIIPFVRRELSDDEKIDIVAKCVLEKYHDAFEELAKNETKRDD